MTPERWTRAKKLFQEAVDMSPGEREAFLRAACPDDPGLVAEVLALLRSDAAAGPFLDVPSAEGAESSAAADLAGRSLGPYRLLRLLGRGGMGEVYLADDTRLRRPVALKVLPSGASAERFAREARAASSLTHPNVAHIYDVGEDGGTRYIAMEYVQGRPMADLVHAGPLGTTQLLDLAVQIADALDEAHAKGVVHRDIKPQNLLVTPRGQVKVLDFGLAKLSKSIDADVGVSTDFQTRSGLVMGTVDFMSPEQALGRETDHRTDLFSLGVVLYFLATGRRPFGEGSTTERIDRILHAEPEPIAGFHGSAGALGRIIGRCLEKERERRYQTAHDLLVDLRNLQHELSGGPTTPALPSGTASKRRPPTAWWLAAAAVLVALLASIPLWRWSGTMTIGSEGPAAIETIAVLPLTNLSAEPGQEYFAVGLTELLTTELAKLSTIKVIAPSSVGGYRDEKVRKLDEIARALKVQGIVQGTVSQAGERVRITAQLVHTPSNAFIWAETFEGTHADLFALQNEVARAIATRIEGRLTPQHQQRLGRSRPVAAEASQLYLKGRFEWAKRTPEAMKEALDHYERALEIDPGFALAYAGIADYYNVLPFYSSFAPKETFPKAKEAVLRALEIDPSLSEARASLGYIKTYYEWDWPGAEQEFHRALELRPSYADLHHWYSRYLTTLGRHDEAIAELRRAHELDPLARIYHANLAMILYFARRYDDAIEQLQRTLELYPDYPTAYWGLGLSYEQKGMLPQSVTALEKARELGPRNLNTVASLGHAYAIAGDRTKARAILEELQRQSKLKYVSAYQIALVHVGLGEQDEAMSWLEQAVDERATLLSYVGRDPRFDALRADPRFTDLTRRIKLPS